MGAQIEKQKYNFPDGYEGDTYKAISMQIRVNGVILDLTDYTIAADFRKNSREGDIGRSVSTGNGITITDAVNGIFKFDEYKVELTSATWFYDWEFTKDAIVSTYVFGSQNIAQQITDTTA